MDMFLKLNDETVDHRNVAPGLPPGHEIQVTKDDLPEEEADDDATAGDMGDFVDAIDGDDY